MSDYTFIPSIYEIYTYTGHQTVYTKINPLYLYNREDMNEFYHYKLVIKLSTEPFLLYQISSAILSLPIQNYQPFCYFNNAVIISVQQDEIPISQQTYIKPIKQNITSTDIKQGILSLNLYPLLKNWDSSQLKYFTIMLELQCPNLSLQISNQSTLCPQIHLEAVQKVNPTPPVYSNHPIAIALSTISHKRALIDHGDRILYDQINFCTPEFTYDNNQSEIIFHDTGYYYLQWIVNLLGCCSLSCIHIGIQNDASLEFEDFCAPCIMPAQVTGQHIIHVKETGTGFSIINNSQATIQLSNIDTQSSLIIFKL